MSTGQKGLRIVGVLLLLLIAVGGWFRPVPEPAIVSLGTTNLDALSLAETLAVTGASTLTGAVTAETTLGVTGASTFTGNVGADADLTVDDTFAIDDTDSTITGTQTLVPTASFYQFNPASTLTLTLSSTNVLEGDFLWITNINASNDVVVVDTTATAGGGNRTVSKNDVLGFIFSNSVWAEAFYSDNS